MSILTNLKDGLKKVLVHSPIALTKNMLYDQQTRKIFSRVLQKDSNCIDVGCHTGEIMDLILQHAPLGHHFGFEPLPHLNAHLHEKYSANDNITIHDCALSNVAEQEVSFNYVVSNPAYSGLQKRAYAKANEEMRQITVQTAMLDHLIPDDLPIDLVKIDVEGGEMLVLEGATDLIKRNQPYVIFEHGLGAADYYGTRPEQVFDYFDRAKMQLSTLGRFLQDATPLTKADFVQQFDEHKNYYFIAHP
ncbi:MAG: FkbM family methyltransferase [Bacteroidota bacterium]